MINIAGAFRTQFPTEHFTYGLKEKQIIAIEKTHETNIYEKSHLIATTISSNTSMVDNFYQRHIMHLFLILYAVLS